LWRNALRSALIRFFDQSSALDVSDQAICTPGNRCSIRPRPARECAPHSLSALRNRNGKGPKRSALRIERQTLEFDRRRRQQREFDCLQLPNVIQRRTKPNWRRWIRT